MLKQKDPADIFLVKTPDLVADRYIAAAQVSRDLVPLVKRYPSNLSKRQLFKQVGIYGGHALVWPRVPMSAIAQPLLRGARGQHVEQRANRRQVITGPGRSFGQFVRSGALARPGQ